MPQSGRIVQIDRLLILLDSGTIFLLFIERHAQVVIGIGHLAVSFDRLLAGFLAVMPAGHHQLRPTNLIENLRLTAWRMDFAQRRPVIVNGIEVQLLSMQLVGTRLQVGSCRLR